MQAAEKLLEAAIILNQQPQSLPLDSNGTLFDRKSGK